MGSLLASYHYCNNVVPSFFKLSTSCCRMEIILSAMPFTSCSHWGLSSGLLSTMPAIRAPWTGGLEYIGRIKILIWERTLSASSLELHVTDTIPALSPEKKNTHTHTRVEAIFLNFKQNFLYVTSSFEVARLNLAFIPHVHTARNLATWFHWSFAKL